MDNSIITILTILKIAFLNILRNKRRSFITLLSMAIGSAALIVLGGFIEFSFEGLRESTIRTQLGHFQIYQKGYKENSLKNPYNYLIEDYEELSEDLRGLYDVDVVTQRLGFSGLISANGNTFNALFVGVPPDLEASFASYETIIDGRQLSGDLSNNAVVGSELALALDIKVGDILTVLTTTLEGTINAIDIEVVGIARSGSKDYDRVFVKLPLKMVQNAINTNAVASIVILLNDTENLEKAEKDLKTILKLRRYSKYTYSTWIELAEFYQGVYNLYSGFFNVFKITVVLIVFFSIYNTISMSIFERTREIGVIRAIGFNKLDVIVIFLLEGLILGLLGAILGVCFGIAIAQGINLSGGIYISPPPGQSVGYVAEILIINKILLQSSLIIVITSILSSIYPSISGAKKEIIGALNHV